MNHLTPEEHAASEQLVERARKAAGSDPRPKLGLAIIAKAERDRAAALERRACDSPEHEWVAEWRKNARIASAAAEQIQAMSDAVPAPAGPAPGLVHPPHDWKTWQAIEAGSAEPDEYKARVIEAMAEARASGLSYNCDTGPRAAAIMAARWGYPDAREGAPEGADFGTVRHFGSHCYSAGSVLRERERRAAYREAAGKLHIGTIPGRIITSRGEHLTSAVIARITHTGSEVEIHAKRGGKAAKWVPNAVEALGAIARGKEWAEKHARTPATTASEAIC